MGKWTRRGFITAGVVGGTALVVGVALRPGNRNPELSELVAQEGESLVNAWLKIDAANKVTVIAPHSEMGQGAQTALSQMLADELDVNWEDVSFEEAPAADEFANWALVKGFALGGAALPNVLVSTANGAFMQVAKAMNMQVTGGSLSIRATGVAGLRVAGAAARELLTQAAAGAWAVDASGISAEDGVLYHAASQRQAPYAEFAARAGELPAPDSPRLKTPDQFKIMGKSKARFDIPAKVDGSARFAIDVAIDGMKYATVAAAPVFGAKVASVEAGAAEAMPGVLQVVTLDDAVAIVADSYWQAKQALAALDINWATSAHDVIDSEAIYAQFQRDLDSENIAGDDVVLGDTPASLAAANSVIDREYRVPYLAHACMEPMNAVASVKDGRCDVWVGSQDPLRFRHALADALAIDYEQVSVTNHFLGGGFGRRANPDVAVQAARISSAAGVPVKLIWSREEDIRHDHYRPAVVSRFRGALGSDGLPVAWENRFVDKHEPKEASHIPYAIANQDIRYVDSPTHIPFGAWRSVDHTQHGFFVESFIDELAVEAGEDPYQYRRKLLADKPRHLAVLDKAAEMGNWGTPLGEGRGRGISLQESFGTLVAEVVEVSFTEGELSVDRVVVAADPGFAVSPDGFKAQMESGVIYGLSAALHGEVTIAEGRVEQGNFNDYPILRMNAAPEIETHIINSMASWGGGGEPGTPGVAPALVNAIFDATGDRIRTLPVSNFDFNYRFPPENA